MEIVSPEAFLAKSHQRRSMKNILIRHLGNMGDMVFFIPPILETLKKKYPASHITMVTAWGLKEPYYTLQYKKGSILPKVKKEERWGRRNQAGFSIHLLLTNPHIDQLIHYHDTHLDLNATTCIEDGQAIPTWNKTYYQKQKRSQKYDAVFELDFGLKTNDNPIQKMYQTIGLPKETFSNYKIYLTKNDLDVAKATIDHFPKPRIVLLEGLEGTTTRGWDPGKITDLTSAIKQTYKVDPIWFGGKHVPYHQGRPLTLRENIARLTYCDIAIGVLSGPLHFAAATGLPTITLYGDQPIHRAAPSYFLNQYQKKSSKLHHTLLGPSNPNMEFLKGNTTRLNLTPTEWSTQKFHNWQQPGRQATKSCLSVITVDEIMTVLQSVLK